MKKVGNPRSERREDGKAVQRGCERCFKRWDNTGFPQKEKGDTTAKELYAYLLVILLCAVELRGFFDLRYNRSANVVDHQIRQWQGCRGRECKTMNMYVAYNSMRGGFQRDYKTKREK